MLNARLVVIGGAKAAEIPLALPTIIGRGRDANLTLPHPLVSRQHCELFEKEGMLHVRDLKSLNGTYVDSQRIEATSILNPDQLLTIGNVTFRAIYSADDADLAEPPADVSNVIEFDEISSADSDSQIDAEGEPGMAARPTTPGKNEQPAAVAAESEVIETIQENRFSASSDVLSQEPATPAATPQHSIVAAMHDVGISGTPRDEVSVSEIRSQLPGESTPEASNIDGLVVDAAQQPSARADFSSIDLEESTAEPVASDESELGSFIRKLPR